MFYLEFWLSMSHKTAWAGITIIKNIVDSHKFSSVRTMSVKLSEYHYFESTGFHQSIVKIIAVTYV